MAGDDSENQGLFEAHTPGENSAGAPDPERAAKVGSTRAAVEASMSDLQRELVQQDDEPEQHSLLLDEADDLCLFRGPVRHVAETLETAKRGRGRPPGSQNKASRDFAETLMRMGFRHPGINLAHMANADPYVLAVELSGFDQAHYEEPARSAEPLVFLAMLVKQEKLSQGAVIGLIDRAQDMIHRANAELLPYFQSKAPVKLDVNKHVKGVMLIGDMRTERAADGKAIDLTSFPDPE